jgi:hypothetical protein
MMRLFPLSLLLGCIAAIAQRETRGAPPPEIDWGATTNNWHQQLWVYRVIPQDFSPAVISNLLAISGFGEKDRSKAPPYFSEKDSRTVFFGELEGHQKHLAICPSLGLIEYVDPHAEASNQLATVRGVPDEQESTRLGRRYLRTCGIDISQIAHKPGTCEFDLHWQKDTILYTDQAAGTERSLINGYGILFARSIDGIKVHGFGGMDIVFGNDAKVSLLRLCWRNLSPAELITCPSPRELTERLQKGEFPLHPLGTKQIYPPAQLKKLRVTKATFLYEGPYYDEPVDLVRPYISFEGVADDGRTQTPVWFECRF